MEQKHVCASICDGLPTKSANHPWLVDQNLEDDIRDHIIYTIRDPPSQSRCRIPSFLGRPTWGCFYGWVILSNHPQNDMWSLWNPLTNKIIRLPRLILENGDECSKLTQQCCLSSPPDAHGSIFMLPTTKYTIVFCRLDCKRKRLKWVEMSYAKQMRSITGCDRFLCNLTCSNGRVYALSGHGWVIHIDIVVRGKEVMIRLLPYLRLPCADFYLSPFITRHLKGCCSELFCIELSHNEETKETFGGMCVFKLDITNKTWKEVEDLKDAAFFVDLARDYSVLYTPSDAGGYVHFLDRLGKVIHSFDFKNRTIALSLLLEHRSHGKIKAQQVNEMAVLDEEVADSNSMKIETRQENMESHLLNIPSDVLRAIMEFCVGVEYLNFRATCKRCHLAAPLIRWSKGDRLRTYSLVSPWLMVVHKDQGIISFTDPLYGDRYFIKTPQKLIGDLQIYYSMGGWLLIRRVDGPLMFFNPFTGDIRELPFTPYLNSYCFSAPPTSSDCMVVGFTTFGEWQVYIHFVALEQSWYRVNLNFRGGDSHSFRFATQYGQNLYALYKNGGLGFIDADNQDYTWLQGPRDSCTSPKQNFLMKYDQHLLLVIVGVIGESVEVFKMNGSRQWEKAESLGRHAVYIGDKTCLCIETKTVVMANRIYFPRVHSENKKILFYSLETRRYHTFNMEDSLLDFMGTEHYFDPYVWIEPSWS